MEDRISNMEKTVTKHDRAFVRIYAIGATLASAAFVLAIVAQNFLSFYRSEIERLNEVREETTALLNELKRFEEFSTDLDTVRPKITDLEANLGKILSKFEDFRSLGAIALGETDLLDIVSDHIFSELSNGSREINVKQIDVSNRFGESVINLKSYRDFGSLTINNSEGERLVDFVSQSGFPMMNFTWQNPDGGSREALRLEANQDGTTLLIRSPNLKNEIQIYTTDKSLVIRDLHDQTPVNDIGFNLNKDGEEYSIEEIAKFGNINLQDK